MAAPPQTIIDAESKPKLLNISALWQFRELMLFLAWRDVTIRYKQTLLGASWAILQPLLSMLIFTLIFGMFAKIPSDGYPYAIFNYTALLPWQYFASAVTQCAQSLVQNERLITKVYFPRLIIPISSVLPGLVDILIAFLVMIPLMLYFDVALTWKVLALPFFVLLAMISALGIGIWIAAFNVQYRDFRYVVPFMVQFLLFASPVTYSLSIVPEYLQPLYSLNPMVGVITGFRWSLLGSEFLPLTSLGLSALIATLLLITGVMYFQRVEDTFADVV